MSRLGRLAAVLASTLLCGCVTVAPDESGGPASGAPGPAAPGPSAPGAPAPSASGPPVTDPVWAAAVPGSGCALPGAPAALLRSAPSGLLGPVEELPPVVQVTGGAGSTAALTGEGTVLAWSDDEPAPRAVPAADGAEGGLADVAQVAADSETFAARTTGGRVVVWGNGDAGQAGNGAGLRLSGPTTVVAADGSPLEGVVDLAVDGRTLAAVLDDGTVTVWGDGRHGQLGAGTAPATFARTTTVLTADGAPLTGVVDVAVGGQHVVAATEDGRVLTWGSDSHGQLGRTAPDETGGSPVEVSLPAGVVSVAANELNTYAVTDDGRVLAWGNDESGQTGSGGSDPLVERPAEVAGADGVVCVSAGEAFAVALTSSGEVLTWGAGGGGQLAAGPQEQRREPGPALVDDGDPVAGAVMVGAAARTLFVGLPLAP